MFDYVSRRGGRLPEGESRVLFQQLVSAVAYCHRKGVVNRDVKLENVMVATGGGGGGASPSVRLCDFGSSKVASSLCDPMADGAYGCLLTFTPTLCCAERSAGLALQDICRWVGGRLRATMP